MAALQPPAPGYRLVRAEGDGYAMGLQHGRALGTQLQVLRTGLYRDIINCRGPLLGWGAQALMCWSAQRLERFAPARFLDEIRGVADGAGLSYRDALLMACFDDVVHSLQTVVPLGRLACSGLAVQGARAASGNVLLARNMDYAPETDWWGVGDRVTRVLRDSLAVFVQRPARGYGFVSVSWPGFIGAVTGMNEAGLTVACLTSTVPCETADGEPTSFIYRRVLEEAATLQECEAILRSSRRTIGNNLMVASAQDNAARVFEFSPRRLTARRPTDDVLLATNHFQHPFTAAEQRGYVLSHSLARLERLAELTSELTIDRGRAQRILRDHVDEDDRNCILNGGTIYSVVADPIARRLWVRPFDRRGQGYDCLEVGELLAR